MAGNKCEYYNCGRTRRQFPEIAMHRFPSKNDQERQSQWVFNSGIKSDHLKFLYPFIRR